MAAMLVFLHTSREGHHFPCVVQVGAEHSPWGAPEICVLGTRELQLPEGKSFAQRQVPWVGGQAASPVSRFQWEGAALSPPPAQGAFAILLS